MKIHPTLNPLQFIGSEVIRFSLYGKGDREFEIVNEFNENNIYWPKLRGIHWIEPKGRDEYEETGEVEEVESREKEIVFLQTYEKQAEMVRLKGSTKENNENLTAELVFYRAIFFTGPSNQFFLVGRITKQWDLN